MSERLDLTTTEEVAGFRGSIARRGFLKTSGRMAIAAPAVVLLMSATSKGALAVGPYDNGTPTNPGLDLNSD